MTMKSYRFLIHTYLISKNSKFCGKDCIIYLFISKQFFYFCHNLLPVLSKNFRRSFLYLFDKFQNIIKF